MHCHQSSNGGGIAGGSRASLEQILDEVGRGREEQRKCRDEIRSVGQLMARLEVELSDQIKQQADADFTVETSGLTILFMALYKSGIVL